MAKAETNTRAGAQAGEEPRRNRKNVLWYSRLGGVVLMGVAVAVILASAGGGFGTNPAASEDLAPDFSFTLFKGQEKLGAGVINLSDLKGRPVVLNFWAGLCPPCRAEMPDLQSFYEGFDSQVTVLGVYLGQFFGLGSQRDALELLNEVGVNYPSGFTSDAGVVQEYKVLDMPTTFFIDSEGKIFKKWPGPLNEDTLTKLTTEMLEQESGQSMASSPN